MGRRHYVHTHGKRILLSCGGDGLGKPDGSVLAVVNTLDSSFCVDALQEAIGRYGRPEIFNTDQGSQFTSDRLQTF